MSLPLTEREMDIAGLIAEGLSNRDIAKRLYISEGTVKNHISSILSKLDLKDRTQIAVFAIRNHI
nr:response regulator transcription factor [Calorimonas adulescens]